MKLALTYAHLSQASGLMNRYGRLVNERYSEFSPTGFEVRPIRYNRDNKGDSWYRQWTDRVYLTTTQLKRLGYE